MNVKLNEFKKIITSPVILSLLIIFIFFNFFIIFENSFCRAELKILNNTVSKFGYKVDKETLENFKNHYNENLKKMNEITYKKTSKTYESASEFFQYQNHERNVYSKDDIEFFKNLSIEEGYYFTARNIDSIYNKIDIMQIAEGEIKKYNLSGKAAEIVRSEYKSFNKRFNELIKNEEHKNLFFMGNTYRMHSLLFKDLFRSFIFEIIILSVLITGYSVNYEFDNSTQLLAYSTKRGRNLIKDKLLSSIFANLITATLIISTGIMAYFSVFNYSGLWNIPISSYFNAEYNHPYMSKWNMTFIQYLICGIVIVYILTFLFTGITFVISRYMKNSYIVFFIFATVFAGALVLPSFLPTDSSAIFIGGFTPFILSMNSSFWFMESGAFATFKYYELIIVLMWTTIMIISNILSIKSFKKIDIS